MTFICLKDWRYKKANVDGKNKRRANDVWHTVEAYIRGVCVGLTHMQTVCHGPTHAHEKYMDPFMKTMYNHLAHTHANYAKWTDTLACRNNPQQIKIVYTDWAIHIPYTTGDEHAFHIHLQLHM